MSKSSEYQSTWHKRFWGVCADIIVIPIIIAALLICLCTLLLKWLPFFSILSILVALPLCISAYVKRYCGIKEVGGLVFAYIAYIVLSIFVTILYSLTVTTSDRCELNDNYTLNTSKPDVDNVCIGHTVFSFWHTHCYPYGVWLWGQSKQIHRVLTVIFMCMQLVLHFPMYRGWFIHDKEKK